MRPASTARRSPACAGGSRRGCCASGCAVPTWRARCGRARARGQQQKVAIARSLLPTPSLLLMDEPTTGLDPRSKREVQKMVEDMRRERDVTILVCTHDLEEAAALCDRVLLLDRGRVLADGTPAELGPLEPLFFELSGRAIEEADVEED